MRVARNDPLVVGNRGFYGGRKHVIVLKELGAVYVLQFGEDLCADLSERSRVSHSGRKNRAGQGIHR